MNILRINQMLTTGLLAVSLAGCVSVVPHESQRSPEIRGRVLDVQTHEPVEGATIALQEHPSTATRSDGAGAFILNATHNVHFLTFMGICSSEFPPGKYYSSTLEISHSHYQTQRIHGLDYLDPHSTNTPIWVLRDVSLVPITK